jgi:hypothetical protein
MLTALHAQFPLSYLFMCYVVSVNFTTKAQIHAKSHNTIIARPEEKKVVWNSAYLYNIYPFLLFTIPSQFLTTINSKDLDKKVNK